MFKQCTLFAVKKTHFLVPLEDCLALFHLLKAPLGLITVIYSVLVHPVIETATESYACLKDELHIRHQQQ